MATLGRDPLSEAPHHQGRTALDDRAGELPHPPEQTAAETGMNLSLKRVKQVDQLVRAIEYEVIAWDASE